MPSTIEAELFYEFLRLRDGWPDRGIEIKGSSLDELQAAQVVDLLSPFDVLVKFFAVDMATHSDAIVDDFRIRQAAGVTAHLTPAHYPRVVAQLEKLAASIRNMPNQLFVQAFLTIELILEVIQEATLYFVQRQPQELGEISWTVDRKDRTITEMERTWTTLILPFSESHFARNPLKALHGADYSYFDTRYGVTGESMGEKAARHLEWVKETYGVQSLEGEKIPFDAKLLLTENRKFEDSRDSLGLQLTDILATILRRALNGRLQPQGWLNFGRLLVRKSNLGSSFLQLGGSEEAPQRLNRNAEKVCRILDAGAKSMLLER